VKYLVDADVLIQAHNAHYQFSFHPGFWDWLIQANQAGTVHSVEAVYQELSGAQDQLSNWATQHRAELFVAPDQQVTNELTAVAQWAQSQPNYTQGAIADFLAAADAVLIAHARAHDLTVVTHERSAPDSQNRIKIPDACMGLGVPCIDPFTMLDTENARFVI
jgi:predicted nucleic acid-binding protein